MLRVSYSGQALLTTPAHQGQHAVTGIVLVCAAIAIMTGQDAVLKWLSGGYAAVQILFVRSILVAALSLGAAVAESGTQAWVTTRPAAHLLRGVLNFLTIFLFIQAIAALPLADAMAIAMAAPLFTLAASAWLLGETVGWRRWSACLVGFGGVLLMLRPAGSGLNMAGLYALGAALSYALFAIQTRRLTSTERTGTMLLYSSLVMLAASALLAPWNWKPVASVDLGLMLLAGVLVGVGHYLFIQGFRHASAATLAPLEFTALVWSVLLGWLIWDELPDATTQLGATLVVGAGLYVVYRETHAARRAASQTAP